MSQDQVFNLDIVCLVTCMGLSCSKAVPQHDAATPTLLSRDCVLRLASFLLLNSIRLRALMLVILVYYG